MGTVQRDPFPDADWFHPSIDRRMLREARNHFRLYALDPRYLYGEFAQRALRSNSYRGDRSAALDFFISQAEEARFEQRRLEDAPSLRTSSPHLQHMHGGTAQMAALAPSHASAEGGGHTLSYQTSSQPMADLGIAVAGRASGNVPQVSQMALRAGGQPSSLHRPMPQHLPSMNHASAGHAAASLHAPLQGPRPSEVPLQPSMPEDPRMSTRMGDARLRQLQDQMQACTIRHNMREMPAHASHVEVAPQRAASAHPPQQFIPPPTFDSSSESSFEAPSPWPTESPSHSQQDPSHPSVSHGPGSLHPHSSSDDDHEVDTSDEGHDDGDDNADGFPDDQASGDEDDVAHDASEEDGDDPSESDEDADASDDEDDGPMGDDTDDDDDDW